MARATQRLTALKVEKAKDAGMYPDGAGLYLRVTPDGTKNWVLRYMLTCPGQPRHNSIHCRSEAGAAA